MKKPNLIIGKKHIVVACLTLLLGLAVYMNYALGSAGDEMAVKSSANYGDAEFVSADSSENDYFAQARLTRMTSRDEAVQTLKAIMDGGDLTDEEAASKTVEAVALSQLVESESKVESLIKAQGFEDCVVYLDGVTASVVVKSEGLVPSEAAQIKDIIVEEASVSSENIRIFEVK